MPSLEVALFIVHPFISTVGAVASVEAVDIARITAFSFGVGVALSATGIAILARELGTASPRAIIERVRARLGEGA